MKNVTFVLRAFLIAAFLLIAIDGKAQSAGTLDTSFGSGGIAETSFSTDVSIYDVAVQPDGKFIILGGGGFSREPGRAFFVARFNTDGTLDTTFNGTGYNNVFNSTSGNFVEMSSVDTVVLQPDGKIVIGSSARNAGLQGGFGVIRFNQNGTIDTAFNGNGIVLTTVGTESSGTSVNV